MHQVSPYFYSFGSLFLSSYNIDDPDLPALLVHTFKARLKTISDYTQTSKLVADRWHFVNKLTNEEKQVYKLGHESEIEVGKWMARVLSGK